MVIFLNIVLPVPYDIDNVEISFTVCHNSILIHLNENKSAIKYVLFFNISLNIFPL